MKQIKDPMNPNTTPTSKDSSDKRDSDPTKTEAPKTKPDNANNKTSSLDLILKLLQALDTKQEEMHKMIVNNSKLLKDNTKKINKFKNEVSSELYHNINKNSAEIQNNREDIKQRLY